MGPTDLGLAGLSDCVPLTLTGQEPATNIQNEIDGAGMHDDGVDGGTSDRVVGGDDLGASEAQPGSAGETFGQGDGGEPSGARDPRELRRTSRTRPPISEKLG